MRERALLVIDPLHTSRASSRPCWWTGNAHNCSIVNSGRWVSSLVALSMSNGAAYRRAQTITYKVCCTWQSHPVVVSRVPELQYVAFVCLTCMSHMRAKNLSFSQVLLCSYFVTNIKKIAFRNTCYALVSLKITKNPNVSMPWLDNFTAIPIRSAGATLVLTWCIRVYHHRMHCSLAW